MVSESINQRVNKQINLSGVDVTRGPSNLSAEFG